MQVTGGIEVPGRPLPGGWRRSARALARVIAAASIGTALTAGLGPSTALATGTVRVTTALPSGDVGVQGGNSERIAVYVDSAGAAHIAWIAADNLTIDLCTIPAGGNDCGDMSTLTTDANVADNGYVESIKYLPDDADGSAYLAAGIDYLTPAPSFDSGNSSGPGTEEELFALGRNTGLATGEVTVGSAAGATAGGGGSGDVILEPDGTGVDVVGEPEAGPPAYEFESLTAGGTDSGVIVLSDQDQLIDVTKLPEGQTAVLADPTDKTPGPVSMFVQSTEGGPFGPPVPLGISGPSEATSSSQDSYVLNVETQTTTEIDGIYAAPMELYRFRGLSLRPVATVGAAVFDLNAVDWANLPPVFEDGSGDFYAAWYTNVGFDGCNPPGPAADYCLMYRRIAPGGLLGPKLVVNMTSVHQGYLGPIGADSQGAGWILTVQEPDSGTTEELDAVPLPSSAAAGPPSVAASSVDVPVSCGAGAGSNCGLTAVLVAPTSGGAGDVGSARLARAHTLELAHLTRKLRGGASATLVLKLDRAGARLLARRHRLKAELVITQALGSSGKSSPVLSKSLTFKSAARSRR